MNTGGAWSGRYLVWPLELFVGLNLTAAGTGRSEEARRLRSPHETARVDLGDSGIVFPLRDAYAWWNETLEGLSTNAGRPGPEAHPPAIAPGPPGNPPADEEEDVVYGA